MQCPVSSPCVGINAPERAARELLFSAWLSIDMYDLRGELRPLLAELAQSDAGIHVGEGAGDLMKVDLRDLDTSAQGLVSGLVNYRPRFSSTDLRQKCQ